MRVPASRAFCLHRRDKSLGVRRSKGYWVILSPTPGAGPSRFIGRDGELFWAVVTGKLAVENNGEVHCDRGIEGEEIPFGDDSLIDFLNVSENEIEARD